MKLIPEIINRDNSYMKSVLGIPHFEDRNEHFIQSNLASVSGLI